MCAFFIFYLVFGFFMLFRLFTSKSNSIIMLILIFGVLLISFPFTNKFQFKGKMEMYRYNKINYLLRDNTDELREHRDSESYLYYYFGDKNIYVSETDNHIFSSSNKHLTYQAYDFNMITDTDLDLTLSNEVAANIANDNNYYYFIYEHQYQSDGSIKIFAYVGEDLHDTSDIMVCSDSKGCLYFIPKRIWEELK